MANETFQDRFVKAVRYCMAEMAIWRTKEFATELGIENQTLSKIMTYVQKPTVDHCILICKYAGISAEWLFMGVGEMKLEHQASLNDIYLALTKKLTKKIIEGKKPRKITRI